MASTTSSRSHEQVQQTDCWNDWNNPAHHHSSSFTTPMRAMEGKSIPPKFILQQYLIRYRRPACLLTAGGHEQHHYYRSELHQQGAGPPVAMQETCDKNSVSPTPSASHHTLSSGLSPLGSGSSTGNSDPSSVTKEERSSRQRGHQPSPSPSKLKQLLIEWSHCSINNDNKI